MVHKILWKGPNKFLQERLIKQNDELSKIPECIINCPTKERTIVVLEIYMVNESKDFKNKCTK